MVDDHDSLRRLLLLNLELAGGFEVVGEAADGPGAVRLAVALRPDVLVVDLGLPGASGASVVAAVRDQAPEVRVVVFTGWAGEESAERLLAAGAARYVVKTDVGEIVEAIREVGLDRHGAVHG